MGRSLLLETATFRLLRECLEDALEYGANSIVYGPPSSEKSFVLMKLAERFRAAGKPVIYAYSAPTTTLTFLYRTIAEAAGIATRSIGRWACRQAVLDDLSKRPTLPVIVLDEAQHLELEALEAVREIHEITSWGRPEGHGCGIILAGSHGLLQQLMHPQRKGRLEQMLSRFPRRLQLEGMTQKEVLTLAARALGNGKPANLTEDQQKKFIERCTVVDPFFLGPDAKPAPRTYYSSRRLLEYIRQQKKNVQALAVEAVA